MPATNNGAQPLAPDAKRWGPRLINAHVLGEGKTAQKFTGIPVYGRLNNSTPLKSLDSGLGIGAGDGAGAVAGALRCGALPK